MILSCFGVQKSHSANPANDDHPTLTRFIQAAATPFFKSSMPVHSDLIGAAVVRLIDTSLFTIRIPRASASVDQADRGTGATAYTSVSITPPHVLPAAYNSILQTSVNYRNFDHKDLYHAKI